MTSSLLLAFTLIVLGLVLLVAEAFLPTGGILFGLALAAMVLGIFMTFQASDDPTVGLLTVAAVFVGTPILGSFVLKLARKTRLGRRLILQGPADDATLASMPVYLEIENLRGKFGRAVSHLRPAGVVDFDGKRIDVLAEGDMVDPGEMVRCLEVRGGRVIVRRTDAIDLDAFGGDGLKG